MRKYLIAGLLVWIPLVIALWVITLLINFMDQSLLLVPERFRTQALFGFHVPGMGAVLTILIVFVTGALALNFFGKKLLSLGERLLNRIPIFSSIYGGVKQISDTLFSPDGKAFRKAVLVRYPHQAAWTVALLTGEPQHEVTEKLGSGHVAVFVPTTPNITAGFFLLVPKADVIDLGMTIDQALKYIISMGVAEPLPRTSVPSHSNGAEMKKSGTDPNR
jgi:uncharacterized membrane protein